MDEATIQRAFNERRVWERVCARELTFDVVRDRLAPPEERSGQPEGTRSQKLLIATLDGEFLASAHRYLRPGQDRFGGQPDPNRLVTEDRMLTKRRAKLTPG